MRSLFKLPLWPSLCKGGCNYILRQLRRYVTVERRYVNLQERAFGGHDFTGFGSEYEGSIHPGLNSVCMCLRCQCAPRGAPHCQFCGANSVLKGKGVRHGVPTMMPSRAGRS